MRRLIWGFAWSTFPKVMLRFLTLRLKLCPLCHISYCFYTFNCVGPSWLPGLPTSLPAWPSHCLPAGQPTCLPHYPVCRPSFMPVCPASLSTCRPSFPACLVCLPRPLSVCRPRFPACLHPLSACRQATSLLAFPATLLPVGSATLPASRPRNTACLPTRFLAYLLRFSLCPWPLFLACLPSAFFLPFYLWYFQTL